MKNKEISKSREITLKCKKKNFNTSFLNTPYKIVEYSRNFYKDDIDVYESIFAIFLDYGLNTLAFFKVSQGGISGSVVDIKLILKCALDVLASTVILIHNHPSGNMVCSKQDKEITNKLNNACKLMDLQLLDSIIISSKSEYFSFKEKGLI